MLLNDLVLNFPEDKNIDNIIVRQYISIADKMEIIGNIVNNSVDANEYYNPTRLEIYYVLNMVKAYTNIDLGEEEILIVYDKVVGSGIWQKVQELIPDTEKNFILTSTMKVIENIYSYRNSIAGIIEVIQNNYTSLIEDNEQLQKAIADPKNLNLLKNIVEKLG